MHKIESDRPSGLNFSLMKNKKGFIPPLLMTIFAFVGIGVIAVGILAAIGIVNVGNGDQLNIRDVNQGTQARLDQQEQNSIISGMPTEPQDGLTDFDFIAVNPNDNSGTTDWNAVTVKVKEKGSNSALKTYTTDADGTFASASLDLPYPKEYYAWVVGSKNTTGSAGPFLIKTVNYGAAGDLLIDVPDFDHIRLSSCYDEKSRGDLWNDQDASAAGTTIDLATASPTIKSTTNNTAKALANSETLRYSCYLDVADYKQWGDVRNFMAVDADTSDYESTGLSIEGMTVTPIEKAELSSNDQGYLSAYEDLYLLGGNIKSQDKKMVFTAETKSTGTVDADMKMRFLAEVYRVSEDGKGVEKVIFGSDGTELYQAPAAEVTLDIS